MTARPHARRGRLFAQRGVRAGVPPGPLDRQPPPRALHASRTRPPSGRGWDCRCRARSAGAVERNRVKRLLREAFARSRGRAGRRAGRRRRGPPRRRASSPSARASRGCEAALVGADRSRRAARRRAGAPRRRSGVVRRAGPPTARRRAAPSSARRLAFARALARAPIVVYQRADLAGAAAALQVRADVLALRGRSDRLVRHTQGPRARGVAPAQVQPVERRRVRSSRGPASVLRGARDAGAHGDTPAAVRE